MVRVFLDNSSSGKDDLLEQTILGLEDGQERLLGVVEDAALLEPPGERQGPFVVLGGPELGVIPGRPGRDEERPVGALEQEFFAEELLEDAPAEAGETGRERGRGPPDPGE